MSEDEINSFAGTISMQSERILAKPILEVEDIQGYLNANYYYRAAHPLDARLFEDLSNLGTNSNTIHASIVDLPYDRSQAFLTILSMAYHFAHVETDSIAAKAAAKCAYALATIPLSPAGDIGVYGRAQLSSRKLLDESVDSSDTMQRFTAAYHAGIKLNISKNSPASTATEEQISTQERHFTQYMAALQANTTNPH